MDHDLKEKFAPWCNKRHAQLCDAAAHLSWAEKLDWKKNAHEFQQLVESVLKRADADYRERFGLRIDQLAERNILYALARNAANHYEEAEQRYRTLGIYDYLDFNVRVYLNRKAQEILETRKKVVKAVGTFYAIPGITANRNAVRV